MFRVGIIGSGQLGSMLIMEGRKLPFKFHVLDTNPGPASALCDSYYPPEKYRDFVDASDVVTYEFEHVFGPALEYAAKRSRLVPGIEPVMLKRERVEEKLFLSRQGLPVAPFSVASDRDQAIEEAKCFGKAVIKSSRGGYDGKGQYIFQEGISGPLIKEEGTFLVEKFIEYDAEASVVACIDASGNFTSFTPSFNYNEKGILLYNKAPFNDFGMKELAHTLMSRLHYVGVMGIEFFIVGGKALINEFAPRVHNTGHHTLHGSSISQFEQHLRAIAGLPTETPELFRPSGIMNLVGITLTDEMVRNIVSLPSSHLYWYGKSEVRRRRKMGHVNICADTPRELQSRIEALEGIVYPRGTEEFF